MAAKKLSRDDYLKALALVVSANELHLQVTQFDMAMQRLLGMDAKHYGEGKLGELIYDDKRVTVASFDEALKQDGYVAAVKAGKGD